MWRVGTLWRYLQNALEQIYDKKEAHAIARYYIAEQLQCYPHTQLVLLENQPLNETFVQKAMKDLQRLLNHEPVQYVVGVAYFWGLPFKVNKNVFIPRPETELLITQALKVLQPFPKPVILDVGTGSGCIAIILAKLLPHAQVYAIDSSAEALKVAIENAKRHKVFVKFYRRSMYHATFQERFHLVVSNPPYIPPGERSQVAPNVLGKEPSLALFTPDESGLKPYEALVNIAQHYLFHEGWLLCELHPPNAGKIKSFIENSGIFKNVSLYKDFSQQWRVAAAQKR